MKVGHWEKTFKPYCLKLQNVDYSMTFSSEGEPSYDIQIQLGHRLNYQKETVNITNFNPFQVLGLSDNIGWMILIEDRGFQYKVNGELNNFKDQRGENVTVPQYLDGAGGKLDIETNNNKAKLKIYQICHSIDFNTTELRKI